MRKKLLLFSATIAFFLFLTLAFAEQCDVAADCEGMAHIAVPGEWQCKLGECIWKVSFGASPIKMPDWDSWIAKITNFISLFIEQIRGIKLW